MPRSLFKFSILIVVILAVTFTFHLTTLNYLDLPLYADKIIEAYIINAGLAIVIYIAMLALKNRFQSQMGFLFMFGSALKFLVFFIVFYPFYKLDDVISRTEFFAFFLPYATCLIIETISLSKWLNKVDSNK
ncbi:hypothetical protein OE09_0054 [Flavobacteriaceae bacterium MAR_2010_72]|nr:hypothetical protein OE09_0054 [Flavobacteriaceae bacterium MAR_2010_72]TVZ58242.1 hypothetical protein NA63_0738 [Flavobacteriaceae bacterium MAR_2010_105]